MDRKHKYKKPSMNLKSFGNFMQRLARSVSSVSINTPRQKRRSQSMNLAEARGGDRASTGGRRGSVQSASDVLDRPSNSRPSSGALRLENDVVPGVSGIKNHGNTCFMNAVLQCLCHTDLLAEYFVTDQYKNDIRRNNKLNSKKFGTKGELTEALAVVLKSLWSCQYTAEVSSEFKAVVGKHSSQYRGYSQHDAQEFLMWILDKIHEDLNIATKKKYRANKSSNGRSDEAVAAEALANHMRCNNSFVNDLFQALYRSSLTCPTCLRQSNTFDPFLSVSLPIPQKSTRPVFVTVVYLDARPKQVRIGLLLNQNETVKGLRQILATDTKIPEAQMVLTELNACGFQRTYSDLQPVSDIHESDCVYAIETPQPVVESGPHQTFLTSRYLLVLLLNKHGTGSHAKRFGSPVVIQVPRDITYPELQKSILNDMGLTIRGDTADVQTAGMWFKLRVVEGLPGKCYLPHDVDLPLYMPTVDRALQIHSNDYGPMHLMLIAEWDTQSAQSILAGLDEVVEEHASVRQIRDAHMQPVLASLDECFNLYTQEETLGADDAWLCPNCKKRQLGTIKMLSLWSLPDILVIHLKRFKQNGVRRTKLNTLITFPVSGLDMSSHVTNRNSHSNSNTTQSHWSPWRRQRRQGSNQEDYVYDLYGVCNHYGNMAGGHYTAYCKNPADNQWYSFDDQQVTAVADSEVVTRNAYLLFYQRRTISRLSNEVGNHWVYNMHNFSFKPKVVSHSHEDLLDDGDSGIESTDGPSRSVHAYATMRMPRTRSSTSPNIHAQIKSSTSVEHVSFAPLASDNEDLIPPECAGNIASVPNTPLFCDLPPERTSTSMSSYAASAPLVRYPPPERSTTSMSAHTVLTPLVCELPPERSITSMSAHTVLTPLVCDLPPERNTSNIASNNTAGITASKKSAVTASHWTTLPAQSRTPQTSRWDRSKLEATILPTPASASMRRKETANSSSKKETVFEANSEPVSKSGIDKTSSNSTKKDTQPPPQWDYKQNYVVESYV